MSQLAPVWHGPPPEALLCEGMDGLRLVYHRSSGLTHLLAEPLPQILALLSTQPATLDALIARLGASFDLSIDRAGSGDVRARVHECLLQLAAMGLAVAR